MQWTIPGTTLTGQRENADRVDGLFQSLFLAGGLSLSQVSKITGLEPYTIQNWVKRGFLPSPQNKRYDMEQVCRLINLNILKGNLTLDQTVQLMGYLNGNLADESDDLVDDTMLFFLFVRLAARVRYIGGTKAWDDALVEITEDYVEPVPGARDKLIKVLKIMLTIWCANALKAHAKAMMAQLYQIILSLRAGAHTGVAIPIDRVDCHVGLCPPRNDRMKLCKRRTKQWKKMEPIPGREMIPSPRSRKRLWISSGPAGQCLWWPWRWC